MAGKSYFMVICDTCGDYSYSRDDGDGDWGVCSTCAEGGLDSKMRRATQEEECDACNNPHRNDRPHSCGRTHEDLDAITEQGGIA